MEHKKLLVLDLDETLLYASLEFQEPCVKVGEYFVQFRPFLGVFLQDMSQEYSLALWSSASDSYVEQMTQKLQEVFGIAFLFSWGSSRCSYSQKHVERGPYKKDMHKIVKKYHFPLEHILIVDDSPEKVDRNFGNAIYIDSYCGGIEDTSLVALKKYLLHIKNCDTFRKLEKRRWRSWVKDVYGVK